MFTEERIGILVFDVETAGIPQSLRRSSSIEHEILQLAMIDGAGRVLFERNFKPTKVPAWPEAESIHGITPDAVRNEQPVSEYSGEIQTLIHKAELLIAYNFQYDYVFLRSIGISFTGKRYCDVMKLFAHTHGPKRSDGTRQYVSLEKCAGYYGYNSFEAHNAVADAKATLYCYLKLQEELHGNQNQ